MLVRCDDQQSVNVADGVTYFVWYGFLYDCARRASASASMALKRG